MKEEISKIIERCDKEIEEFYNEKKKRELAYEIFEENGFIHAMIDEILKIDKKNKLWLMSLKNLVNIRFQNNYPYMEAYDIFNLLRNEYEIAEDF